MSTIDIPDSRIRCRDCAEYSSVYCRAAARGDLAADGKGLEVGGWTGIFARRYRPHPDILRHCPSGRTGARHE